MMFPTRDSAENAVRDTKKTVYAIKPLAGGRVEPLKAFRHVFSFDVDGCMIGAGSVDEVNVDVQAALEALGK
jgi:hypothetical protein